jgi:glucose-6-phosphate 1-dehydrogenase
MDFNYDVAFGSYSPEAYERLLLDAILGDSTLFIRDDEVEGAWRIIDSIEAGWAARTPALSFYPAGSWGPTEATALLERENRHWSGMIDQSAGGLAVEEE